MKDLFKNVTKSYRPHFALGFIKKSIENAVALDDIETYRHEVGLIWMALKEFYEAEENDREYTGIF